MGHTQLKIGVQLGRVEHSGERKVRLVQKEEMGGRQNKHKKTQKKLVKKRIFYFFASPTLTRIDRLAEPRML
jgi:hypothetical protein